METDGPTPDSSNAVIWDYYKPRHTHAWNMLVLSWRELYRFDEPRRIKGFEIEYAWENFILRLWLYRVTVNTLTTMDLVTKDAKTAIAKFDQAFMIKDINTLQAIRNMFEHFDEYAAGLGRGPATRADHLDPSRPLNSRYFVRDNITIDRMKAFDAAKHLRN